MATGCPVLDSEFVTRQNGKKLPCERLAEENTKLRDEFRKMDEWHSKELLAAIDENKKLRKLVRDVMPIVCNGCHERLCEMPKEEHPFVTCSFADRMRELGVEP